MNGFPYFQFHVDKWLTGKISAFDLDEQGLFIHFCMVAWSAMGPFKICSTTVQRRYRKPAEWVEDTVNAFIEIGIIEREDDKYRIKFIDEQIELLAGKRQQRVDAGKASAEARKKALSKKDKSKVKKSREEKSSTLNSRSTTVQRPLDELFEECWISYGKYGVKKTAYEYWKNLTDEDRESIKKSIPDYLAVIKAGRKQMQFEGWINPSKRKWDVDWEKALAVESADSVGQKPTSLWSLTQSRDALLAEAESHPYDSKEKKRERILKIQSINKQIAEFNSQG